MKKVQLPLYEAPIARDLSGLSVNGQVTPQGYCGDGSSLTYTTCANGPTPAGGICSPNGNLPELGYCRTGGNAREGCQSGTIHT